MKKSSGKLFALIKENIVLLNFNLLPLLFFEAFYAFIGRLILYPFFVFLLEKSFYLAHHNHLSGSNIKEIFTNPLFLIALFLIMAMIAFYALLEVTTLIVLFNASHFRRKVQILPLCRAGFLSAIRIFKPQNIILIFFIALLLPFANFVFTSSFIRGIQVPEFIMDYILKDMVLSISYYTFNFTVIMVILFWIFLFNFFTLEKKNFISSAKSSVRLLKNNFWRMIILLMIWNSFLLLIIIAIILSGEGAIFLAVHFLSNHPILLSLFIGFMKVASTIVFSLYGFISTPLNFALISSLYFRISKEKNCPVNTKPLSTYKSTFKLKNRSIIILVSLALLITTGYNCFLALFTFDATTASLILIGPKISGHRGDSVDTPENTMAAFEKAIELGADYIELDVAQTKDGVIVVSHDSNLKRTAGVNINIWESTYDEIKNYDIGSFFDPSFSDQRIPTLDEVIKLCKGKIKLNIELKPTGHEASLVQSTIDVIDANDFSDDCFLASLNYPALEEVEKIDSKKRTSFITPVALGRLEKLPVDVLSVEATFVTPELISALHKENKEIHVWTVDNEVMLNTMINLHVDNIITDDIAQAQNIIKDLTHPDDIFQRINLYLYKTTF